MNSKYILTPNWNVHCTADEVLFRAPFLEEVSVRIPFEPLNLIEWVRVARAGATEADLTAVTPLSLEDAQSFIRLLIELGLLSVDHPRVPPEERYSAQVEFFDEYAHNSVYGADYDGRLHEARISLLGLGGYGTQIALQLCRIGVKSIIGFDDDTVEESNLNRQILFSNADLGRPKVVAASDALKQHSPTTRFKGYEKRVRLVADMDLDRDRPDLIVIPLFTTLTQLEGTFVRDLLMQARELDCAVALIGGPFIGPIILPNDRICPVCISALDLIRQYVANRAEGIHKAHTPSFLPKMLFQTSAFVWEIARYLTGIGTMLHRQLVYCDAHSYKFVSKSIPDCTHS